MRQRISIRGYVRASVRPLVRPLVCPSVHNAFVSVGRDGPASDLFRVYELAYSNIHMASPLACIVSASHLQSILLLFFLWQKPSTCSPCCYCSFCDKRIINQVNVPSSMRYSSIIWYLSSLRSQSSFPNICRIKSSHNHEVGSVFPSTTAPSTRNGRK